MDGDTVVVSAGDDGSMYAWEVKTGVVLETFAGSVVCRGGLVSLACREAPWQTPSPQFVAACQADKAFVNVWAWRKVCVSVGVCACCMSMPRSCVCVSGVCVLCALFCVRCPLCVWLNRAVLSRCRRCCCACDAL
jgi:hypothetical protein